LLLLAPQLALDRVLAVEDTRDAGHLFFVEVTRLTLRVHPGLAADLQRGRRADAADVTQGDVRRLVVGQVDAQDTWHVEGSPLALASPGAACGAGWCRSHRPDPAASPACSSRKSA